MAQRYFVALALLLGLATAVMAVLLVGRWLAPGLFGALPPWLPEDLLLGLGYQLVHDLAAWTPALAFSAVLLTFSFWLKADDLPTGSAAPLVGLSTLAILVSVLFAVVSILGQPWVDAQLDGLAFRQDQARQLEDEYLRLKGLETTDRTEAETVFEAKMAVVQRLGLLRPDQAKQSTGEKFDYDFELQLLRAHQELDEFIRLRTVPESAEAPDDKTSTVDELLQRGEAALADGTADKEYLANLWGYQAYKRLMNAVDQGKAMPEATKERAKSLVETSWERIYTRTLAADERKKASYFFRKGKSLGDYQFQNYLESYYGFRELHNENPTDAEVTRYWTLSLEKIHDRVLFRQDMDVLFAVPGQNNLVFRNRDNPLEVVRIGRLLDTAQGVYVKDLEFLRLGTHGETLLHWKAPYGRWGADGIEFRVWEKDRPQTRFPVVLESAPNQGFDPEAEVDPPVFQPRLQVKDLQVINAQAARPQTLGTLELQLHSQAIAALGYNPALFQTEFVVRLAAPFGFFVAFLALFVLAWGTRVANSGRSWWLVVPVLPLVLQAVTDSLLWLSRLTVGSLVSSTGLTTTTIVLGTGFVVGSVVLLVLAQRAFSRSSTAP